MNLEMHSEIVIERVWRCTCGGHDHANLKAVIDEFGDALGGRDRARSDEYLEAVDGRRPGC